MLPGFTGDSVEVVTIDESSNSSTLSKENLAPKKRSKRSSTSSRRSSTRGRPRGGGSRSSKVDAGSDSEFPSGSSSTTSGRSSTVSSLLRKRVTNAKEPKTEVLVEAHEKKKNADLVKRDVQEESSSDSDNEDEDVYVVERIDGKQVLEGVIYYFIKWKGWDESSNTWEPFENLDGCAKLLEEFESREGIKSKRSNLSRSRKKDLEIAHTQEHMKTYGILPSWPEGKDPGSVVGVIHVDGELVYVVRKKCRSTADLDRTNAVLVRAATFKLTYPHLVIEFYEQRVVWADNDKSEEEQAYVAAQMALFSQNVGSLVGKQVGEQIEGVQDEADDLGGMDDDDNQSIELGNPGTDVFGLPQDLEDTDASSAGDEFSEDE